MKNILILVLFGLFPCLANADIEVLTQLNFGTIAILDNSNVETMRLYEDGRVTKSNNILIVTPGEPASVRVFNLAPNTPIVVTNTITDSTFNSSEPMTNTLDFTALSSSILLNTDESGEVIFKVGGSLATNANGSLVYGDSFLLASFDVTINF